MDVTKYLHCLRKQVSVRLFIWVNQILQWLVSYIIAMYVKPLKYLYLHICDSPIIDKPLRSCPESVFVQ